MSDNEGPQEATAASSHVQHPKRSKRLLAKGLQSLPKSSVTNEQQTAVENTSTNVSAPNVAEAKTEKLPSWHDDYTVKRTFQTDDGIEAFVVKDANGKEFVVQALEAPAIQTILQRVARKAAADDTFAGVHNLFLSLPEGPVDNVHPKVLAKIKVLSQKFSDKLYLTDGDTTFLVTEKEDTPMFLEGAMKILVKCLRAANNVVIVDPLPTELWLQIFEILANDGRMKSIAMACRTSKRLYGAGLPLVLRKIVACTSKEPGRNEIDIFRQLSAFLSSGTGVDKLKHVRSLDLRTVGIASHEQDRKRVVQLLRSCMPHLESLSLILTHAWDPEGLWRCLSLSSGQLKELKLFLWLPGCTHMKWMDNPIPPSVERMVTFVTTSTAQVVSEALFAKVERVPGLKWELHSTKSLPVVNISWKTFREALSKLRRLTTTGKQLIDNVAWLEKNNVPPLPVTTLELHHELTGATWFATIWEVVGRLPNLEVLRLRSFNVMVLLFPGAQAVFSRIRRLELVSLETTIAPIQINQIREVLKDAGKVHVHVHVESSSPGPTVDFWRSLVPRAQFTVGESSGWKWRDGELEMSCVTPDLI